MYRNTSPIRHRPIRWITLLKYKNVSLVRPHAPSFNAFPFWRIGTVKDCCFRGLFVQSTKLNTYVTWRYSLKCWLMRFTYKAPSLIRPVPYKWGITVRNCLPIFLLIAKYCIQWGMLILELSSYVSEIPNDAYTTLAVQLQAAWMTFENNERATLNINFWL